MASNRKIHEISDDDKEVKAIWYPLLTVACLLDIASLYAAEKTVACGAVMRGMLAICPELSSQIETSMKEIAENICMVCEEGVSDVTDGGSEGLSKRIHDGVMAEMRQKVLYLRDSCMTLCCVVYAVPDLALLMLGDDFYLVEALGRVHDYLIPRYFGFLKAVGEYAVEPDLPRVCADLEISSEKAVSLLLESFCNSSDKDVPVAGGSSGADERSLKQGEGLLHCLTLLQGRDQEGIGLGASMVQALILRHKFYDKLKHAMDNLVIQFDEVQKDYLAALLGVQEMDKIVDQGAKSEEMEDMARILKVKEVLPDYGEGFIAMCLDALGGNPEQVLDALLMGPLPEQVGSLDQSLGYDEYKRLKHGVPVKEEEYPSLPGRSFHAVSRQKKQGTHAITSKYLDLKDETYRDKLHAAATAMQWEYEDEYDDSFDELLHLHVEDGNEEATEKLTPPAFAMKRQTSASSLESVPHSSATPDLRKTGSKKLYVLDGKIYNYAKEGARQVESADEANRVIAQDQLAKLEIHGLGPGGNSGVPPPNHSTSRRREIKLGNRGRGRGHGGRGRGQGRSSGRGRHSKEHTRSQE